ncbi:hypothetical protein [Pediococcus argentinicus]|uniref:Bacterial Ig domain-containing protein n=1 Tax=Pediococcus argentinicus TaxID=480391 RepID=A0A0R2NJU0_9LACO|nr:hypothetical protein [Pediococcus argentinicus]KRO26065.1 hypothetical protein IV88_GL000980 [Pediococcus argentinicus]NKZ21727.1 hypothetical protein [Pediococcus argentinicus]GEP18890.1 hypothetical protein LSA03_02740 [Pediococcus argentinicus]
MKKTSLVVAVAALTMGVAPVLTSPVFGNNVVNAAKKSAVSNVTTTKNTISVTNMKKGTSVSLLNSDKKVITTKKVTKNGTVTFKLSSSQLKKVTAKNSLKVAGTGYSYSINFNFVNYVAPKKAKKVVVKKPAKKVIAKKVVKKTATKKNTTKKVTKSTPKISYVTNTANSVSVTNIQKGAKVNLVNSKKQVIASQTTKKAGTVTFKLSKSEMKKVTATGSFQVTLTNAKYTINFNFVGYKAPGKVTVKKSTKPVKQEQKYSDIYTNSKSVTVTNVKKDTVVILKNSKKQIIATTTATKDGSVVFNLSKSQAKKMTSKASVNLVIGNGNYPINFNYIK